MTRRLLTLVVVGITVGSLGCRRDTEQATRTATFAGDAAAPVSDPPRPESVPVANCATLTSADVGKLVWVSGRPWGVGDINRDTPAWIFYDLVIEDGTPMATPVEARCKVVKMNFSGGSLPRHIGIAAVVSMGRDGFLYLSYDGMGPPCGINGGYSVCTRVSTPSSVVL